VPDELLILRSILARDPDGGETEPTGEDYERFRQSVIHEHGEDIWRRYCGRWEPGADV
jgi:hypothetical protein